MKAVTVLLIVKTLGQEDCVPEIEWVRETAEIQAVNLSVAELVNEKPV